MLALLALGLEVGQNVQAALALGFELFLQRGFIPALRSELVLKLLHVLLALHSFLLRRLVRRALGVQLGHSITVRLGLVVQFRAQLLDRVQARLELRQQILSASAELRLQRGLLPPHVLHLAHHSSALLLRGQQLLLLFPAARLRLLQQRLQRVDVRPASAELVLQRLAVLALTVELRAQSHAVRLLLHQLLLHLLPRLLLRLKELLQVPPAALLLLELRLDVHSQLLLGVEALLEVHLDAQFPVRLRLLGHAPPRFRAVLDPAVVHDLQRLPLQLEQQRLRVHLALRAVTHQVRGLLGEVLVKRRARRLDELADVVADRAFVARDAHDSGLHARNAVLVADRLIQHLVRVRHHAARGQAIFQPRVGHDDLRVAARLLVVRALLVRGHQVRALGGVPVTHACAEHLQLVANRVRVFRGVVYHGHGHALEVHEHLLHPGEVLGARVPGAGVVEVRGVRLGVVHVVPARAVRGCGRRRHRAGFTGESES